MKTGVDERINTLAKKVEEQTIKVITVGEEEKEMKKTIELENRQNFTNTMVARGGEKEGKEINQREHGE